MILFLDSEGEPIQEFTALYVDPQTMDIVDVFHEYVKYPYIRDSDRWARQHVHGLHLNFLSENGLVNEEELKRKFHNWLSSHPYDNIYGHAPRKEEVFLQLPIVDICLQPWKTRRQILSHRLALSLKKSDIPICGVQCSLAHKSYLSWRPKNRHSLTPADCAKFDFGHHCSLYDCTELYFEFMPENKKCQLSYLLPFFN